MNLNLRRAIVDNMKENSEEQIEATILDAIQSEEEKMLPGLGVLFELYWQNCDQDDKNDMLQTLESSLKK
ncbi:small acid-soluble spore protein SspI [Bacillaceae bacterium S4-13-58]